jgi:hypothetical protein
MTVPARVARWGFPAALLAFLVAVLTAVGGPRADDPRTPRASLGTPSALVALPTGVTQPGVAPRSDPHLPLVTTAPADAPAPPPAPAAAAPPPAVPLSPAATPHAGGRSPPRTATS